MVDDDPPVATTATHTIIYTEVPYSTHTVKSSASERCALLTPLDSIQSQRCTRSLIHSLHPSDQATGISILCFLKLAIWQVPARTQTDLTLMEGSSGAARISATSPLYYPSFKPNVIATGIALHPYIFDPEPVLVLDGPLAYLVKVKIPCRAKGLLCFGFGMTEDDKGMHVDGTVDVYESRIENYPFVRNPGMRRLYSPGHFSFTFSFPQRVDDAIPKGRCYLDGTVKFLVPKKTGPNEPESDTAVEAEAGGSRSS